MIYVVQVQPSGPVKIGHTDADPFERAAHIQTACPYPLAVVALSVGGRDDEAALHRKFSSHRLIGEWFLPVKDIIDLCDQMGHPEYSAQDKVTTTITLPAALAEEVKVAAARAGIGWTQMMAVLIRQALDAQGRGG